MKYFKVIKDNFLWEQGTILKQNDEKMGYVPIDQIYYKIEDCNEYISSKVVEKSPEYFLRVYPVNLLTKIVYKIKQEAMELIKKNEVGNN